MENAVRILLVEDEVINALVMKKQLERIGYQVSQHVTTGEKAIISARQNPPDIILMDIRLAGELDGIDAAAAIKAEADIPIVFITGYDDKETRDRAKITNPLGFLVKPVDILTLKSILEVFST